MTHNRCHLDRESLIESGFIASNVKSFTLGESDGIGCCYKMRKFWLIKFQKMEDHIHPSEFDHRGINVLFFGKKDHFKRYQPFHSTEEKRERHTTFDTPALELLVAVV